MILTGRGCYEKREEDEKEFDFIFVHSILDKLSAGKSAGRADPPQSHCIYFRYALSGL